MQTDDEILKEAQDWVKAINKTFKIKQPIVVKLSHSQDGEKFLAQTTRVNDQPYEIAIYPKYFKRGNRLFQTVYHEMVHILLHPLIESTSGPKQNKLEEAIVCKLETLMAKVAAKINAKD